MASDCLAQQPITFEFGIIEPTNGPIRRSPAKLPKAYIDGRQLSFEGLFGCQLLEVLQDDEVVYSAYLPAGSSTVSLPESLSGEYEIRLLSDNSYYFFGFIHFQ